MCVYTSEHVYRRERQKEREREVKLVSQSTRRGGRETTRTRVCVCEREGELYTTDLGTSGKERCATGLFFFVSDLF